MEKKETFSSTSKKNRYSAFFGLAYREQKPNGVWFFKIIWSRLIVFLCALIAVGWLSMSFVIYCGYKYWKNYDKMTFYEAVIFPFNQTEHRVRMGDYNIEKGFELLKAQKFQEAFKNLTMGITRSPRNIDGRLIVARIYIQMGRPDIALEVLEVGLLYALDNTDYMRMYMRLLIDQSEDRKLVNVAEKLLASDRVKNPEVIAYLAMSLSSVYALHGNYDKSKEFLVKYKLDKTLPGILRISKNEWEQGRRDEAIKVISDNFDYAHNKEPLYSLLVNYYTIMKDIDKARQYSMLRSIENPFSMEQRMEYLNLLKKSGDTENLKNDLDKLFEQYRNDNKGMLYLANYAADSGDVQFMRRIYDAALTSNFQIAPYCLLTLETMLTAGDYKAATDFSEEILKEKPVWVKRYEDVLNCLRAIAYYGIGNSNMADILLRDVVKRGTCAPKVLIATARRLDMLNATLMAHRLLENIVDRYPRHQLALVRLVQMEIKIGNSTNLEKHILKLLSMRRPSRELIEDAKKNLGSDKFVFTKDRSKILGEIDKLMLNNVNTDFVNDIGDGSERVLDSSSDSLDF